VNNPQSSLYNVLHGLSSKWSKYPEPVHDYKFLQGIHCPICGPKIIMYGLDSGLSHCTLCRGKGVLPKLEIDLAWPDIKFGIEVQGGIYKKGKSGHSSGVGIQRDILKAQLAIRYGWTLVPVSSNDVDIVYIVYWIAETLTDRFNAAAAAALNNT